MKKRVVVAFAACLVTAVLSLVAGVPVAAAESSMAADEAGAGMIILAAVLVGLALALIIIRVMAGKMSTIHKQDSAKGYGQKLILTEKSDVYLYSRTTSRTTQ